MMNPNLFSLDFPSLLSLSAPFITSDSVFYTLPVMNLMLAYPSHTDTQNVAVFCIYLKGFGEKDGDSGSSAKLNCPQLLISVLMLP